MKRLALLALLPAVVLLGCSKSTPLQPSASALSLNRGGQVAPTAGRTNPGQPGYEPAYYDGQVYTINAIDVPNVAPEKAQADFYEVVYPANWQALGLQPPQCNPCDHQGNGIDPSDYHDHVLDSVPASPGHGEYRGLWHVWAIAPAYNGNASHDAELGTTYAAHLPATSEAAINDLLALRLSDHTPVVVKQDTHFYFLCAVVGSAAASR